MSSEGVWDPAYILFHHLSPPNYILLFDPTNNTISKNSQKKLWFYSYLSFAYASAALVIYFTLFYESKSVQVPESRKVLGTMFGILYIGVIGLFTVFTLSIGFRGNTFYDCFNTVVKIQGYLEGKFAKLKYCFLY